MTPLARAGLALLKLAGMMLAGSVILTAIFLALLLFGGGEKASTDARERLTRHEFAAACRVDRQIEVCAAAVGRPDRTQSASIGTEYWYYRGRTVDETSGKPDRSVQVVVEHGVVRRLNFN